MAVSRDQYGFVHSRLSKALAPDLNDADALLAAEEDWRDDTGAKGPNETGRMVHMPCTHPYTHRACTHRVLALPNQRFEAYAESLFCLADVWAAPSEEVNTLEQT